ncbi:diguanylate cyclase [Lysobacter sp. A3-1-A15]|uniref:diguanylate cyclase n=1 Tax=Novilysobacter viscosus TaxID=3098602 RepID=UPI002EDA6D4C
MHPDYLSVECGAARSDPLFLLLPYAPAMSNGAERPRHLSSLPKRAYRFRVLGLGLAALPLAAVMLEIESPPWAWAWMVLSCLLWPHLAYFSASRAGDPFKAELRNFMVDSMLAGSWVPLMHFNLLPSAVLLTVVTADKINSGVRGLWLRSLPGMFGALVLFGLFTGFAVNYVTSTTVLLASLPIMVIHTLAVSWSSYELVRRVRKQNLRLAELSRRDMLTGLDSRRHWQEQAETSLRKHQAHGQPATLLFVDVDHFKPINDRYGHAAGDDVLRAIAAQLQATLNGPTTAGRLGGDEFAIVLPLTLEEAAAAAERLRVSVAALRFPEQPELRCSLSLGMAEAPGSGHGLREWMETADRELYRSKQGGRNQTSVAGN